MDTPNIYIDVYKSYLGGGDEFVPLSNARLMNWPANKPLETKKHKVSFDVRDKTLYCRDSLAFDYYYASDDGAYSDSMGIHPGLIKWAEEFESGKFYWEFSNEHMLTLVERETLSFLGT